MAYYKAADGELIPCPANVILKSGPVFNYHLLPGPVLEADGWKSAIVEEDPPEYDPDTQELVSWYEDCGTYIARRWRVEERGPTEADKDEALEILGVEV